MCEGKRGDPGLESCQRCYWDQSNALTDRFYQTSVKPLSYICSIFLLASYIIGLWFSLRTHAAQIWETPVPPPEYRDRERHPSLTNWRRNIPDEPFLKRIGERISTRFLSTEPDHTTALVTEHGPEAQGNGRRLPSASDASRISTLTPEDSAAFVRNVAEVAAAAATLAVRHSQTPTPQPGNRPGPGGDVKRLDSTGGNPHVEGRATGDWDHDPDSLAVGAHDAPNWSRTKSSVILFGATILYAIIAGALPLGGVLT
jgi:Ca2+:H+ antiporter